jgi:hypothetical protein
MGVNEPEVCWARVERLDVVVEGDVCEYQFKLLRREEATRTAIIILVCGFG